MAKVSVVIPAYNAERFLPETLRSVEAQTFRDFEVIVVDDGSRDSTASIAEAAGGSVRCIRKPNGGVATARNEGIARSSGGYIAFLDADDLWEPAKLERQVALLDARTEVGACFAATRRFSADCPDLGTLEARHFDDYCEALLLFSCVISGSCSSIMVRREILDAAGGFDPAFSQCADWDLHLRIALRSTFAPIPETLVRYRVLRSSMSSDISLLERDTFAVLKKFFQLPEADRYRSLRGRTASNHWMILSGSYLHAGDLPSSIRCALRGIQEYPRNVVKPLGLPGRWVRRTLGFAVR